MITALLVATRDLVRSQLKLNPEDCMVLDNPRPSPTCGLTFVSIYGTSWSPDTVDQNLGLDERAEISITITRRYSATPWDLRGQEEYVTGSLEMETLANKVKVLVHQNYELLTAANAMLPGTDKLMEPLRWLGGDAAPQTVGSDWFSSDDTLTPNAFAGLTLTINFGRARRMQALSRAR